jgi:hypothetical protein
VNGPVPPPFQLAAARLGEFCTHHWLGMSVVVESEPERVLEPAVPAAARFDVFLAFTPRDRSVARAISKGLREIGRRPTQLRALRVRSDDTGRQVGEPLPGEMQCYPAHSARTGTDSPPGTSLASRRSGDHHRCHTDEARSSPDRGQRFDR